jgi:transcriptional regulator with XRE-family HTH domain
VNNGSAVTSGAAYRVAVGRTIHAIRTGRGWSLRALSERAALSVAFLSEIERGRKEPSGAVLGQLAAAFGLPLSGLLIAVAQTLDAAAADDIEGAGLVPRELRGALARLDEAEIAELVRFAAYLAWRQTSVSAEREADHRG